MNLIPAKFLKPDYLQMFLKDKLPFLQGGTATIAGHRMRYPHWPYFWGIFYEIFIEDNYRIDGLKNVRRIIDAGSNIGISALYFAQTYPDAQIECFEPNPEALSYLEENLKGLPNITIQPYALGNKPGTLEFFVDADIKASSIASASDLMTAKHRPSRRVPVEMRQLSTFIDGPVDILKLDIEGGEMQVMEDLVQSGMLSQVQNLLVEFHYVPEVLPGTLTKLLTMLEEQGFFFYIKRGAYVSAPEKVIHAYMIYAFRNS